MTQPFDIGSTASTTQQIPIGVSSATNPVPAPFSIQTTVLDGIPFLLSFAYSQRESCWYMGIATVDGDPIYGNVKLVCGWNLFGACVDARAPAGVLTVITNNQDDSPPGLNDLLPGGRCALMYVTAADIAALYAPEVTTPEGPLLGGNPTQLEGGGAAPEILDGMQIVVPGLSVAVSGTEGPTLYNCASSVTKTITIGGDPTYFYTVTLRIRGVVQLSTPAGATTPAAAVGTNAAACLATTGGSASNAFTLSVSLPATTLMLNGGTTGSGVVSKLDYVVTIAVAGGATVTLSAAIPGSQESANQTDGQGGGPLFVPGAALTAQPYAGQFVQLNVGLVR
jgi:hypothetical protein